MRALVIVCAFNEGVKLEKTSERISGALKQRSRMPTIDVLIADDGSTDGAPRRVAGRFGFRLLRNEERRGVGYLIRKSYRFGLEEGYDILITMAANNKDEPGEFDRLIDPIYQD